MHPARLFSLVLSLAAFAIVAWLYPELPEQIPTHFDLRLQPDAHGSKVFAWLLPAVMLGVGFLLPLIKRGGGADEGGRAWQHAALNVLLLGLFTYTHSFYTPTPDRLVMAIGAVFALGGAVAFGASRARPSQPAGAPETTRAMTGERVSASADAGGGASRTSRALAFVGSIDAAAGLATVSAGYLGCDVRFALLLIGCAALSASTVIALRWHAEANAPTQRAA